MTSAHITRKFYENGSETNDKNVKNAHMNRGRFMNSSKSFTLVDTANATRSNLKLAVSHHLIGASTMCK